MPLNESGQNAVIWTLWTTVSEVVCLCVYWGGVGSRYTTELCRQVTQVCLSGPGLWPGGEFSLW